MSHDDLNLIKLELERHTSGEVAPSQLAHQIETIAAASRTLETALLRERNYSKQLREYVNQVIMRMTYFQKQEQEATERLKELQANQSSNAKQVQELTAEIQKIRGELMQYRNAWGQILAREKHAQYILSRGEVSAKRIQELELALATLEKRVDTEKAGREKAESHASTHRQELQSALVRFHSSEARYNDMARELEAIHSLRKNHTFELSRVEQIAREKFEGQLAREREQMAREREQLIRQHEQKDAEFAREREQLLAEIARERDELSLSRAEFDRIRTESEQARERLRKEMELRFHEKLNEKLSEETQKLKAQAETESQLAQQKISEQFRGEINKLESIVRSLGEESKTLRNELSQARMEVSAVEQSSRQVELDLLRSREEIGSLQKKLTEERAKYASLDQEMQAAKEAVEKYKTEAGTAREACEETRDRATRYSQEICELIQADRKQLHRLVEKLMDTWGSEDEQLCAALESMREACEVRTVRTETPPAKLEIVTTGGSRLNC